MGACTYLQLLHPVLTLGLLVRTLLGLSAESFWFGIIDVTFDRSVRQFFFAGKREKERRKNRIKNFSPGKLGCVTLDQSLKMGIYPRAGSLARALTQERREQAMNFMTAQSGASLNLIRDRCASCDAEMRVVKLQT